MPDFGPWTIPDELQTNLEGVLLNYMATVDGDDITAIIEKQGTIDDEAKVFRATFGRSHILEIEDAESVKFYPTMKKNVPVQFTALDLRQHSEGQTNMPFIARLIRLLYLGNPFWQFVDENA